jgi:hypothetical protein
VLYFAFWGILFPKVLSKKLAEDKGVKGAKYFLIRYSTPAVPLVVSLVASLVQYAVIVALAHVVGATSLCMYLQVGSFVGSLASGAVMHHKFWAQRPFSLIALELVSDNLLALVAATVAFWFQAV